MKYWMTFTQLLQASMIITISIGCSSSSETVSKDEFFKPVEQIVYQSDEPKTPPQVITRQRQAIRVDEGMKDAIIEMIKEQNKRLEEVVQGLNVLTQKVDLAVNPSPNESIDKILSDRDRVSNELLLEMIRDQNQRLNNVIEQLHLLSQNQRGTHSNLVARVNGAPLKTPVARPVPTRKNLDASLSYGKAIQLYQNKQYEKAIREFESLLNRGIDRKLVDNCYFWKGVCYFNLKRGNQAISAFKDVLSYSDSDKAESAYFMIGQCYEQMGAKKLAINTFGKMLKEYPKGSLKQMAQKKLAFLK